MLKLTAALLGSIATPTLAAGVALATPFADTNNGRKFYVCATVQNTSLDAAGFAALTWVEVKGVGNLGETGNNQNILTYDEWATDVLQKGKGNTDAGSPELECRRIPTDPGQVIMRSIALLPGSYAFKTELNNAPEPGGTGTIKYNRGIVTGPRNPNGRGEDFELDIYTLGMNQRQITVEPADAP